MIKESTFLSTSSLASLPVSHFEERRSLKKGLLAFSRKEWTGRRSSLLASNTKSVSVSLKRSEARSVERLVKQCFVMTAGPEGTGFKVETFLSNQHMTSHDPIYTGGRNFLRAINQLNKNLCKAMNKDRISPHFFRTQV